MIRTRLKQLPFLLLFGFLTGCVSTNDFVNYHGIGFALRPTQSLEGTFEAFIHLSMNGGHDRIIFTSAGGVLWDYEHTGDIVYEDGSMDWAFFKIGGSYEQLSTSSFELLFDEPTFSGAKSFECVSIRSEDGRDGVMLRSLDHTRKEYRFPFLRIAETESE